MIGIYCIKNIINNKLYIGKSKDVKKRLKRHKQLLRQGKHFNNHLQSSWKKYGKNSFIFNVSIECLEKDLNLNEKKAILNHKSYNPKFGYNKTKGADGGSGRIPSKETREKMSKAHKGRIAWNKGKKISASHKMKISKNHSRHMTGKSHSKETREKMSKFQQNRYSDPNERKKISDATKLAMQRPEVKKNLSESHKGFVHSEETKKKLSKITKMYWQNKNKK